MNLARRVINAVIGPGLAAPATMLNLTGTLKAQPRREARVVVVGGGVAAGAFAAELVKHVGDAAPKGGKTLCVVLSGYPEGVAPYDRTLLSKEALDLERLTKHGARGDAFPWTRDGAGEPMGPDWFRDAPGVEIWHATVCCGVQLDYRRLTLMDLATKATCELTYEKLVVATGCRARPLVEAADFALEDTFWASRHADLKRRHGHHHHHHHHHEKDAPAAAAPAPAPATASCSRERGAAKSERRRGC